MRKIISILGCVLITFNAFSQTNIAEARNMTLGSVVTVTGIVTNGDELGPIRYIQDETAGIAVYPGTGSVAFDPVRGDEITITGTLKSYNQLLEIDPVTSVTIISTGNEIPAPVVITPSQIGEDFEGQLLKIENASFVNSGGTFSGNTNFDMTSNGESFVIRINTSSNLVGEIVPTGLVDVVSICSQYSYTDPNDGYQLLARDVDDIQLLSTLYFTSVPEQSTITNQGFALSWETNTASSTEVAYGLTENLELGVLTGDNNVTVHTITFTSLEAGEIYFVKAFSVAGEDTTPSSAKPYATMSNSSGEINVYFNHPVDHSVSTGEEALAIPGLFTDTIINYINRAQTSLDLCVYNNNMTSIVSAINAAYNNGVTVRYITDDETANIALAGLNGGIPRLTGNSDGLMHNKILIIDADDANNSWVVTGSTNFTDNNLDDDFNNMICIQDQSLAKAYRMEFNEMWGSSGDNSNAANARFGADKLDDTPHKFVIDNIPVELYFSPSDDISSEIIKHIGTADNDLEFALLTFTHNDLGSAVVSAYYDGVNVKGIIENENDNGTEYDYMIENGLNVIPHDNQYDIHHKYGIIDANDADSDPVLITGSHNWSASAEDRNDENTLVIFDAVIANLYYQEFNMRWQELIPTQAPVAVDDEITVVQNIAKIIDVTENDTYFSHLELNITVLSEPTNGTLVLNGDDTFTYTPVSDFLGNDLFTYQICYDAYPDLCSEATCNITVEIEEAPVAVEDTVSIPINIVGTPSSITYNVLRNDLNPNNVELLVQIVKEASNGNEIMIDSNITYIPSIGFEGKDTIIYEICSENNDTLCSEGLFIITVGDYNSVQNINVINQNIQINPNPNKGTFELLISVAENSNQEITVYNILGEQIYSKNNKAKIGENRISINIENIEKGLYFISINNQSTISTGKFIIE
ncbi:phospholipase D-like domain-containing protein [Bacteroidota bacterium]